MIIWQSGPRQLYLPSIPYPSWVQVGTFVRDTANPRSLNSVSTAEPFYLKQLSSNSGESVLCFLKSLPIQKFRTQPVILIAKGIEVLPNLAFLIFETLCHISYFKLCQMKYCQFEITKVNTIRVAKLQKFKYLSLWQNLNSFNKNSTFKHYFNLFFPSAIVLKKSTSVRTRISNSETDCSSLLVNKPAPRSSSVTTSKVS